MINAELNNDTGMAEVQVSTEKGSNSLINAELHNNIEMAEV